jgi:hypothetical protein
MPSEKYRKPCSTKVCVAFFAMLPSFTVEAVPSSPTSVLSPGEFLAAPNRPTFHGNASTFFATGIPQSTARKKLDGKTDTPIAPPRPKKITA